MDNGLIINKRFPGFAEAVRFDPSAFVNGRLEVIVKYHGSLNNIGLPVEYLNSSFAIITGTVSEISSLYAFPEIEYIELPKTLSFELSNSRFSSCVNTVLRPPLSLTGNGTAIAIIDSGIDYTHPDFINSDGTSRIVSAWDQGFGNSPPIGFTKGTEYTNVNFNEALLSKQPLDSVPFTDEIGHGTAVAGIAAGNGRSSNGRESGIAPEAQIIAVKLGNRGSGAFSRTTEIMRGIKYSVITAQKLGLPLSVNISYGTNDGSHDGNTLFEQYINDVSGEWKTVISVATGNEGAAGHHYSGNLKDNDSSDIKIFVSNAPKKIYVTMWSNFSDDFSLLITPPDNSRTPQIVTTVPLYGFSAGENNITVFMGQPTNYTALRETYFLIETDAESVTEGVWRLTVTPTTVVDGRFDIWLPTVEDVTDSTSFASPDTNVTLTLPSTAERVISVGGYNANTNTSAVFSGRGFTRNNVYPKPDITAPAVDILTARSGGGYDVFSGTSFAAPFVTGSAALMMEWGIVRGNDPFLFGQRIKAFLQKGAKRLPDLSYPNTVWGYGTLCLSQTMDLLKNYTKGGFTY